MLAGIAVLSLASVASFERPLPGMPPWSATNPCGPAGATLAFVLVWGLGRIGSFGVPLLAAAWAWNRLRAAPAAPLALTSLVGGLIVFEICTLFGLSGLDRWWWSGAWGFAASVALHSALGGTGSWIVAGALFGVTVLAASELGFHWIAPLARALVIAPATGIIRLWSAWWEGGTRGPARRPRVVRPTPKRSARAADNGAAPTPRISATAPADEAEADEDRQTRLPLPGVSRPAAKRGRAEAAPRREVPDASSAPTEPMPSLSLLAMPTQPEDLITADELTRGASLLTAKLGDFGIEGRVTEIHPGPVVTTFEFEPAAGVKVNQIVSREDDLALTLRAQRIRILAPIPGKGAVGDRKSTRLNSSHSRASRMPSSA